MDTVAGVFYALVCGGVAASVPTIQSRIGRIVAGAVTGVIASVILPYIRSLLA